MRNFIDVGGTWLRAYRGRRPVLRAKRPASDLLLARRLRALLRSSIFRGAPVIVGLRGVWTAAEKAAWRRRLNAGWHVTVCSDVEALYQRRFGKKLGILLNAGTGSIALGKDGHGRWVRAGGFGPLIGDEGSAFWVGREFLRHRWLTERPVASLRSYLSGPQAVARVAALAPKVIAAARGGDRLSRQVIAAAVNHLVQLVVDVQKKIPRKDVMPLHLAGGLFRNNYFRDTFLRITALSRKPRRRV